MKRTVVLLLSLSLLLVLGLTGICANKAAGKTYLVDLDGAGGVVAADKDAPAWADTVHGWKGSTTANMAKRFKDHFALVHFFL